MKGDEKLEYKEKLKRQTPINLNHKRLSPLARNFVEKLCTYKTTFRYNAERALKHPWITKEEDAVIPLSKLEEDLIYYDLEQKLRKVLAFNLKP